ncbi:unnamed protein product [Candidatus Paraburkholderia kirkii UZHbot1]|uniref:WGS project CAFE00000000 data, contig bkir_c47 n=1 Tax=Candidatus Paraburkholderia kirkii UZHbot1 TaxID=1055526 RepID=U3UAZ7_9BURK|nr:unnamed protein product [Candidatus Paraburkholderia kirkii UZHbot1]
MNHRSRLFLLCLLSVPLAPLAGCTTYYKNVEACKDKVRASYPASANAPLKITGSGESYHGLRVIVHGTIANPPTPLATKTTPVPAAAECTFSEASMTGFQWLIPAYLAPKPPSPDADE